MQRDNALKKIEPIRWWRCILKVWIELRVEKNENELHLCKKYVHIIDCSDMPQIEIDILFSTSLRRIRFLFVLS